MQNYERKFGNEGYGTYGRGNFIKELSVPQRLTFGDFSGGLDMRDSREDTPANSSPNSLDVEVTMRDRLRPVPGTTTSEVLTRDAKQMMLQASLDYTSELVLFDAPFIGVKRGNATVWLDADLPVADRLFASVNFGGTLVFSNGHTGLFMRESGKDEVELIDHGPAAHTFASFAGRIFAGATLIGGNREPLGISWSGATSDPKEWDVFKEDGSQTGAGSELLIDDMIQGNYIVALRTMGLDFMAVFMRNSIWIGRRTSQLLRPADFQPRVTGVGAVNEATCAVTRFGAVHLHDSGVYLFDGNNTTLISEQINNELLPLDRSQLNLYRAAYNPISKLYFLFTPSCTWVYDLERRRWHKRSLIARGASIFAPQLPAKTWAELLGTWADQAGTWEEYKAKELPGLEFLYLGEEGAETALAREDSASRANFGVQMEPYWEFPLVHGPAINQLVSTKEILIDYEGGGKLDLWMPDNDSRFVFRRQANLKIATSPSLRVTFCEYTGRGAGLRIAFQEGSPEILRVQLKIILRGPRIEKLPAYSLVELESKLVFRDTFERADGPVGNDWFVPVVPGGANYGSWIIQDNSVYTAITALDRNGGYLLHPNLAEYRSLFVQVDALFSTGGSISAGVLARGYDRTAFIFPTDNVLLCYHGTQWVGVSAYFDVPYTYDYEEWYPTDAFASGVFRTMQASYGDTEQKTNLLGVQEVELAVDLAGVNPVIAGLYRYGTSNNTPNRHARFRDFIACTDAMMEIQGIPAGFKIRIGATVIGGIEGTAVVDLWGIKIPVATIELLDASNQTVAVFEGVYWPGTYNVLYE